MSLHNFQSTFVGIFNPLLSGVVVSTGLWGLIVGQTWTYFNSTQDGWLIRAFVGVVVAADTALTCVTASIAQHYLIQQFGNIVSIVSTRPSSVFAEYAMNLVIVTLVGLFLAHRVLTRGRNWIITIIITVFTAAHFIAGIFFLVEIKKNTQAPFSFSSKEKLSLLLANAFATIFTLAFAGYLSWQIYAGRAGMKLTGSTLSVNKILSYTVATGSLVAVLQLLNLALCTTLYAVQWWPVHFFTCKFYVLTMVVILNTDLAFAVDKSEVGSAKDAEVPREPSPRAPTVPFTPLGLPAHESLTTSPFDDAAAAASTTSVPSVDGRVPSALFLASQRRNSPSQSSFASTQGADHHAAAPAADDIQEVERSTEDLRLARSMQKDEGRRVHY